MNMAEKYQVHVILYTKKDNNTWDFESMRYEIDEIFDYNAINKFIRQILSNNRLLETIFSEEEKKI